MDYVSAYVLLPLGLVSIGGLIGVWTNRWSVFFVSAALCAGATGVVSLTDQIDVVIPLVVGLMVAVPVAVGIGLGVLACRFANRFATPS